MGHIDCNRRPDNGTWVDLVRSGTTDDHASHGKDEDWEELDREHNDVCERSATSNKLLSVLVQSEKRIDCL